MDLKNLTHAEWKAEAIRRFGPDPLNWKFVCPSCKHIAAVRDWKEAGAGSGSAAFSCVGRWTGSKRTILAKGSGPCNYAGGGLFRLNPVRVTSEDGTINEVMEFAAPDLNPVGQPITTGKPPLETAEPSGSCGCAG